jgi:hypothetical protein
MTPIDLSSQPEDFTYIALAPPFQPTALNGARIVGREQGRALETLAHAVEYLQDEAAHQRAYARILAGPGLAGCDLADASNNVLEAIDALKACNRNLWFSLPIREPLWRKIFHRHSGAPVVTLPMQ